MQVGQFVLRLLLLLPLGSLLTLLTSWLLAQCDWSIRTDTPGAFFLNRNECWNAHWGKTLGTLRWYASPSFALPALQPSEEWRQIVEGYQGWLHNWYRASKWPLGDSRVCLRSELDLGPHFDMLVALVPNKRYAVPTSPSDQDYERVVGENNLPHGSIATIETGWPFLAFRGSFVDVWDIGNLRTRHYHYMLETPFKFAGTPIRRMIPVEPIWRGFLIDSFLFALALGGACVGVSRLLSTCHNAGERP